MTLTLLGPLQRQHKALVADLRAQPDALPKLSAWLHEQYDAAFGTRTGGTYETWRDEQVDQAAVAWVLGTVFVRFCEDNDLIDASWIAGAGDRTDAAVQAQQAWSLEQPRLVLARDWLREAFTHLASLPAMSALFDTHNPVWRWDIGQDAAAGLLDFWRSGAGVHDFTDAELDTRFLGDLYQDLSVEARKRYALLQTPEFVEEFILDLTLEESLKEYGLEDTSLIDPTCGSGHFLLGAFGRLVRRWEQDHSAMDVRVRVQKALDQVTGVDINPFAVAIARFRLLVAALKACNEKQLTDAPGFKMRLAAGDSLLKWGAEDSSHQGDMLALLETGEAYAYYTEDAEALAAYLKPGQYAVAVGNPPYITVKDKFLNGKYRELYKKTCSGKYALSVPFAQRFFQLVRGMDDAGRAGIVGQITANSFMKREFGKKLIEDYFAQEVELTYVIDTSGAYLPGHGTPTVIVVGQRRTPRRGKVHAILGLLGEPSTPKVPADAPVWTAIVTGVRDPQMSSSYVTVVDLPRERLIRHPWSLSGGAAGNTTQQILAGGQRRLEDHVARIGVFGMTNADDVMITPERVIIHLGTESSIFSEFAQGDQIRDSSVRQGEWVFFPYDDRGQLLDLDAFPKMTKRMWPVRTTLGNRATFSKATYFEEGRPWYEWHQLTVDRNVADQTIAWAEVATHNHFILDRSGRVFNQTAPVIRLLSGTSEEEELGLVGLLNSSTACFWLKQVSQPKAGGGVGRGMQDEPWEERYQFNSTKLRTFPLPNELPVGRGRTLDSLAHELASFCPSTVCAEGVPSRERLDVARGEYHRIRGEMIAAQEELDWEVYWRYALLDIDLTAPPDVIPQIKLGERAFEILLAQSMVARRSSTAWFTRHESVAIDNIPDSWPREYRDIVARRMRMIESRPDLTLLENPHCKRRWLQQRDHGQWAWAEQEHEALRGWLLARLDAEALWRGAGVGRPRSAAVLADMVGADEGFRSVLDLYCGRDDYDVTVELTKLVADEAVPFLAAYRYKPSGLEKRAQWERTWDLQRREDAGEKLEKPIAVPPKYAPADFAKTSYWRNRGKLDVPKERFVAYPKVGKDADRSPVIGWAGWDHLEQAQALATVYIECKQVDGWPPEQLLPLLTGLVELEPWLHQWHGEPAAGYPASPAEFYTTFIDAELTAHGADRADVSLGRLP